MEAASFIGVLASGWSSAVACLECVTLHATLRGRIFKLQPVNVIIIDHHFVVVVVVGSTCVCRRAGCVDFLAGMC